MARRDGGQRKRIRVNGVGAPGAALSARSLADGPVRARGDAPRRRLARSLRRAALDPLAGQRSPAYLRDLATYGRALQQRNGLLRAIREEQATRDELRFWDETFLDAGGAVVEERLAAARRDWPSRFAARIAEIAPDEAAAGWLSLRYATNAPRAPGETPRDALARRLAETAEKEVWNGSTLVGPHRDDLVFELGGPRPRRLRLARPAADGDPRPQAGRARPADGARRPAAAAAPRRRVQRARPGAARAPGAPDRRAAPGVRDDDDARRPRPGAARDRPRLGGRGRTRTAPRLAGAAAPAGRRRDDVAPRGRCERIGDLLPDAARAARPRGRAAPGPGDRDLGARSSPSACRPRPGRAAWSRLEADALLSSRRTSRSSPRSCGCARASCWRRSGRRPEASRRPNRRPTLRPARRRARSPSSADHAPGADRAGSRGAPAG